MAGTGTFQTATLLVNAPTLIQGAPDLSALHEVYLELELHFRHQVRCTLGTTWEHGVTFQMFQIVPIRTRPYMAGG